jgi:hypothetical protein
VFIVTEGASGKEQLIYPQSEETHKFWLEDQEIQARYKGSATHWVAVTACECPLGRNLAERDKAERHKYFDTRTTTR